MKSQPCSIIIKSHRLGLLILKWVGVCGERRLYFSKSEIKSKSTISNFEVCYQFFQVLPTVTFIPLELCNKFFKIEVQWVHTHEFHW